ncbi:glycosyltransferase family 2 protein [Granulicella tundricola]|nr:glycosyltransferase family 2 protein [Granulicella tundricola]
MRLEDGCAVVVTYHPDQQVIENLVSLRLQTLHLVVVDNGSTADGLEMLRVAAGRVGFELIENGDNLGIATALNVGVRRALEMGREWVLLFDQDSCVTEGFVETLVAGYENSRWGDRLGLLVPRYVDKRFGTALPPNYVKEGLEAAMTSGSLLRAETFLRHGFFVDELFIDGVDYEYSLRLRAAGMVIDECVEAVLLHSPGEPQFHKLLGVLRFQTANYSPIRQYYQERNKIWIAKRYLIRFPVFCLKLFKFGAKNFMKILVAEEGKAKKCRFFLAGVRDGLLERMGKRLAT